MNKWLIIPSLILLILVIISYTYFNINRTSTERKETLCQNFCRNAKLSEGKYAFTTVHEIITCDCSCKRDSCYIPLDS